MKIIHKLNGSGNFKSFKDVTDYAIEKGLKRWISTETTYTKTKQIDNHKFV